MVFFAAMQDLSVHRAIGLVSPHQDLFAGNLKTITPAKTAMPAAVMYENRYASTNDPPLMDSCQLRRVVISAIEKTVPMVCDTESAAEVAPACSLGARSCYPSRMKIRQNRGFHVGAILRYRSCEHACATLDAP